MEPSDPRYVMLLQSDRGRAALFAELHRGNLHWLPSLSRWMVWDSSISRWLEDGPKLSGRGSGMVTRLAKTFMAECEGLFNVRLGPGMEKELGSRRAIMDMMDLAKTESGIPVPTHYFDHDPYMFGVGNGVVDLRTGELRESRQSWRITKHTEVDYIPGYQDERWESFLAESTSGHPGLLTFLQRYFGYCLTGADFKEKFLVIRGRAGSGKGTLTQAIIRAMGPYAMTTNYDSLMHHRPGSIREDLASWAGKRLVLTTELPQVTPLDTNMVKSVTGGDDNRARHLYKGGDELRQTWSCVATCNRFPRLDTTPDSGWWRRIIGVPLNSVPKRQDDTLKEYLNDPHGAGRAVLAWLVKGSCAFYANGRDFAIPSCVRTETMQFRAHADHAGFWLAEKFDRDPNGWISNIDLYESYEETCEELAVETMSRRALGGWLKKEGFPAVQKSHERLRGHYGLQWKSKRVSHIHFVEEEMDSPDD